MALIKKSAPKKTAKPAAKITPTKELTEKVLYLSDKQIVLNKYPKAAAKPIKNGYVIFDAKTDLPIHSGVCKCVEDAWKLAAHSVL